MKHSTNLYFNHEIRFGVLSAGSNDFICFVTTYNNKQVDELWSIEVYLISMILFMSIQELI